MLQYTVKKQKVIKSKIYNFFYKIQKLFDICIKNMEKVMVNSKEIVVIGHHFIIILLVYEITLVIFLH